jgi:hypothetical protein
MGVRGLVSHESLTVGNDYITIPMPNRIPGLEYSESKSF